MSEPMSFAVSLLKDITIFQDLPDSVLQQLATQSERLEVSKDELIIKKGDEGDSMFVVMRGAAMVHDEDRVLATVISGEYFGEYALIDPYERSASVTATQSSALLKLSSARFNSIMEKYPELNDAILKELIKRLRNLNSMQEQLFKNNREIKEQNQKIEFINSELARINDEKTQIMKVLAHDLRNNLTSSISLGESIQEELGEIAPDMEAYMERLNKSLWRMSKRIDLMLATKSKIEPTAPQQVTEFSLAELFEEIKIQFQDAAKEKDVRLIFKGSVYALTQDRGYTRQILENLVGNAIRFSPGGAKVTVSSFEEEEKLAIAISDNGPGLSKEALKPLTEPTSDEEVTVKNPSDLSLTIVRQYTESMGGSVSCQSQPGQGATFTLTFKNYRKQVSDKGFWDIFKS